MYLYCVAVVCLKAGLESDCWTIVSWIKSYFWDKDFNNLYGFVLSLHTLPFGEVLLIGSFL